MKVLLLGSGGRESALAWALASGSAEVFAAPGNPGIAEFGTVQTVDLSAIDEVVDLTKRLAVDLVVVGPEAPLVAGVADALRASGIRVFGPDAAAARIEGSKAFAKRMMAAAGVPTARWQAFEDHDKATAYLDELGPPYVVKADGLAAGKGVVVTRDRDEAVAALRACMVDKRFGEAGTRVIIEEFLEGQELSLIAFCDGQRAIPCEPAQDYKRVFDADAGPNTGGMGSYSPVPACSSDLVATIARDVIDPMLAATAAVGAPFIGALYAGLALTPNGPRVVEFNARFGDPETQALIPRLTSDLAEICMACAEGSAAGLDVAWRTDVCVSLVLATEGYPGTHATGMPIEGIQEARSMHDVEVFHAGTAMRDGALVTAGGRVLAISALAPTFRAARAKAYEAAEKVNFEGKHLRTDIAARAVDAEEASVG